MLKKITLFVIVLLLFCSRGVHGDAIYLKNGNKVEGIIVKEEEDTVEIRINIGAVVTFSNEDIEKIEKDNQAKHEEIKNRWLAEKAEKEAEKKSEDTFVEGQKQQGLVEYKGDWVMPEEKERLQAVGIAKTAGKGHAGERFYYRKDSKKRSDLANKLLSKGKWYEKETENFSIFYTDIEQAKIVSDKAEYYFEKIAYDLGYEDDIRWDKRCQVYIVESADKWKPFLKDAGFNPELVGGFVPNYAGKEMYLCALSDVYLAITFPHELTHLIFNDIAGDSTIPLWLNEGLANYEASVTSISNKLLRKYIKQGRHILLGDLLRITTYPEGREMRELFYAQAEKLVEFLIAQHGRKKFRKFCELILKDKSFHDSLFNAYRQDFKDIEDFNIQLVEYIVK